MKPVLLFALIAAVAAGAFIWGKHASRAGKGVNATATAQGGATSQRKILYYKSTMIPGEISQHPGKDSMGMDMAPVYANATSAAQSAAPGQGKILYYKSTMIPGEISQHPGKDSMGMDMAPVYANAASSGASSSEVMVDPVTIQDMDLQTAPVAIGPLTRTVRTVGYVDYNEPRETDVTTKFKGWIEKLYVNYTGQLVHRGEPLFKIYSPELYSAEVEYLTALSHTASDDPDSSNVLTAAREKLRFFDISEGQIAELARTRTPHKAMDILAPDDGFVITKNIFEGQVDAGVTLYHLADLSTVWVYAHVYEQDLPFIKLGQAATMALSYLPGRTFKGRITYIYPTVDDKTRTANVRLEFKNPGFFLKPGMYANVTLVDELAPSVVLVPDSAILRSGEKDIVFVALPGGKFVAHTVTLGPYADNHEYEVLSGLEPGDQVVISGQFLLDSETQLQEAIQKLLPSNYGAPPPSLAPGTNAPNTPAAQTNMPAGMNMSK